MDDYSGSKFEWFIWVNITDDTINETLEWAQETYSDRVKFNIRISDVNLGPGGGINRLSEMSKEYEYSIFLEGDWLYIPSWVSGLSHNWIQESIEFLEVNKDVTHIQLRKYLDDMDDRQYTFGYWVRPENVEQVVDWTGNEYAIMHKRMYTNTPCLRRMSAYYDLGVFPLKEFYDEHGNPTEHKGNQDWGQAELQTPDDMKAAWIYYGTFVHFEDWAYEDDWQHYAEGKFGCGVYPARGLNRCKYGYLVPNHSFCTMCKKDKDITDHVEHIKRHTDHVIMLKEEFKNNPQDLTFDVFLSRIEGLIENPTINPREYNDIELYHNIGVIRKKNKQS